MMRKRLRPRMVCALLGALGLLWGGTSFALSCVFPHEVATLELQEIVEDGAAADPSAYHRVTVELQAENGGGATLVVQKADGTQIWEAYHAR